MGLWQTSSPSFLLLVLSAAPTGPDAYSASQQPRHGARLLDPSLAPLRTSGRHIVDRRGERVKWACVNWYGAYAKTHVVGGLEVQPLAGIAARIAEMGFNCVRLPYSTQGYVQNPAVADEDLAANPELQGKRFLELFDLTVQAITDAGLMVIINNHNHKSGWCCHITQDEGLWYVPGYNETLWIEANVFFAGRYASNPLVVAHDLRNEPHNYDGLEISWGDGVPETDWALAATKAGNAVLAAAPHALVVINAPCFGMELRPIIDHPIELDIPDRVVYETHNYIEFQVFTLISNNLFSWASVRAYSATLLGLTFIAVIALWRQWSRLGRPGPGKAAFVSSLGFWIGGFAMIFVGFSCYFYGMFRYFCTFIVYKDILPWLIPSSIVAASGFGAFLVGAFFLGEAERPIASAGSRAATSDGFLMGRRPTLDQAVSSSSAASTPTAAGDSTSRKRKVSVDGNSPKPSPIGALDVPTPVAAQMSHDRIDAVLPSAQPCETASGSRICGLSCLRRVQRRWGAEGWGSLQVLRESWRSQRPEKPPEWDMGLCIGFQFMLCLGFFFAIVFLLYIYANIFPTYWWLERHLDGSWGFALEPGKPWTAPVWMGEFGAYRPGNYWLNFLRYLGTRDVDWAYWPLNGRKLADGIFDDKGNFLEYDEPRWEEDTFSILNVDFDTVRESWRLLGLQALMVSPSSWVPGEFVCSRKWLGSACGG